jgi:hypothetical protein
MLRAGECEKLASLVKDHLEQYRYGEFPFDDVSLLEINQEFDGNVFVGLDAGDDVVACKVVYRALGCIRPDFARDDRLWVYLTHTAMLNYSRQRWKIPDDDAKAVEFIKTHFFVRGRRGFERDNAASRLWWMSKLCDNINGMSLDEALAVFLKTAASRADIIERPTLMLNANVFRAVLICLKELSKDGDQKAYTRKVLRPVLKRLNYRGGHTLLGMMSDRDIESLVGQYFQDAMTGKAAV